MPHARQPSSTAPVAGRREKSFSRSVGYGSRRRRTNARSAGCGTFLFLAMMLASTGAFPFKRWGKQRGGKAGKVGQQQSGSSKRSTGKRDKVKEDVAWLLEDASDDGWKPVRDDGHVKVWKRSIPGSDFVAIKSSATLKASPQALFEVLTPGDIEIVQQYNALVENGRDLEVMDRDNKVSWSATMAIWPCRPRDFVTHIRRATLADGSVAIVNTATTHPKAPVSSQYVRGEISRGVFHIKAAKNKKQSELTMVHHFNPGGNVPAWLMNWLAEGKPLTFVRQLEEVAAKWDEQATSSRSMPCKGRGFADKPCQFLLSSKEDSDNADAGMFGRAWANRSGRGWLALAAIVVTTALALNGRAIRRNSPQVPLDGKEEEEEPSLVGAEKEDTSQVRAGTGEEPSLVAPEKEEPFLVGAETEEEPSPAVNGQKRKEENINHTVMDPAQTPALVTSVESVSEVYVENTPEVSVDNAAFGVCVENVPEKSDERVSTGDDIVDGVVIGDLANVEADDVKVSCQEEVTVDKSFDEQEVSTVKAVDDSEDTPTVEVMTSDVSSEEVRDVEVDGVEECGVASDEVVAQGKAGGKLLLDHVAADKMANQAMPDGEAGNGETLVTGGVGAEEGAREQENNGDVRDEVSTNGCVAAVETVSEEGVVDGCKADGYR